MKNKLIFLSLIAIITFSILSIGKEFTYSVRDSDKFHFGIINLSNYTLTLDQSKSSGLAAANAPRTIPAKATKPVQFKGDGSVYYYFNCPKTTKTTNKDKATISCKKGFDYIKLTHSAKDQSFTYEHPTPTINILIQDSDIDRCGFPFPENLNWGDYDCFAITNSGTPNINVSPSTPLKF